MEATYCIGNDVDVCRMFDQYLYKRTDNLDLSLSVAHNMHNNNNNNNNHYTSMGEHTFHTPSFGDEGFDIPSMGNQGNNSNNSSSCNNVSSPSNSSADSIITSHTQPQPSLAYQHSQMMNHHHSQDTGMQGMNSHNTHHSHQSAYQQPLYLTGHEHGLGLNVSSSYSQPSYTPLNTANSTNGTQNGMLYHRHHQAPNQQQQQQQHHHQQHPPTHMTQPTHLPAHHYTNMGPPATSPLTPSLQDMHRHSNPTPTPEGVNTTSDDSDDSTPHQTMLANKRERLSPEPLDGCGIMKMQQKKPKPTKKKKKRDPNEPQKPVSAYALFFRDTQAAIKGKNPNASFGEVSKIVASMWDSLDADHKNVYKKKTEAAKKDYLKALAAYRASLVSKGGEPDSSMYAGGYVGSYGGVYNGYSPPAGLPSPPMSVPSPHSQVHGQVKKSAMMMDNRVPVMNSHPQNHNQSQQTAGLMGSHNQVAPGLNHLSQHPQSGLPPSPQQSQPPTPPANVSAYWPWCFNPTQNSH